MDKKALSVTIDNTETFAMIEGLIMQIERPEPLLKIVGKYIQWLTKKMFVGARPDLKGVRGEKWPKLRKSTRFKKREMKKFGLITGNPNRPLLETGHLRDDLIAPRAIRIQNKGLIYGTDRRKRGFAYPAVHQTGTKDWRIPARRWLFLTVNEINQITHLVKEWLEGERSTLGGMKKGFQ